MTVRTRLPLLLVLLASAPVARAQTGKPAGDAQRVSFELDVLPVLTARGCNTGACHGKQRGQNGFQLSLLGFDADFDYEALTRGGRGRRIFPAAPEESLLLRKPAGIVPHGGGVRLPVDSDDYKLLHRWIAEGMPRRIDGEPQLVRVEVEPAELRLAPDEQTPLKVTAFYTDDSSRDVTSRTSFQSNDGPIAAVDDQGQVSAGKIQGETAIMSRYMNHIAVTNVVIPAPGDVSAELYQQLPVNNFIDPLVWGKLQTLGITPSQPVDDAKYMRRVYLDIIGRLPTAEEARAYLSDQSPRRREILVDALLERPEYADHWANQWADLLRPNPYRVGIKATLNYDHWIRDQFRQNRPYDQFARDLIAARGSTFHNGAATLFRDRRSPEEVTTMVSQLFLGIRLECARCHHHPFERWGQDDFYSFAAYFARVGRKGTGLSPPISGSEEIIFNAKSGSVKHPITDEVVSPRPLFGNAPELDEQSDPRDALADWMLADGKEFFAQVQVNRVWADLMGRGIVEPVDDIRMTNPPTNGPLLKALADHFRDSGYDQKALIRAITTSQVYALGSLPSERDAADTRNYSRHYRQRMRAEVLLGAIDDITGVPTDFSAMPPRSRANAIWTHRVDSLFLDTFGRPDGNQDPPCERLPESTVTQTLHLMNAPALHRKVTADSSTAAALAGSDRPWREIIEELYLAIYSRYPADDELEIGRRLFEKQNMTRRQATEDLMWAMLNTPEFLFED